MFTELFIRTDFSYKFFQIHRVSGTIVLSKDFLIDFEMNFRIIFSQYQFASHTLFDGWQNVPEYCNTGKSSFVFLSSLLCQSSWPFTVIVFKTKFSLFSVPRQRILRRFRNPNCTLRIHFKGKIKPLSARTFPTL